MTLETTEYKVRIRVSAVDPFHGKLGHDYIAARGLEPIGFRHSCAKCDQDEMLPAVLNILEGWTQ